MLDIPTEVQTGLFDLFPADPQTPSHVWPRSLAPARVPPSLQSVSPLTHAPLGSRSQEGSLKRDQNPEKTPPPLPASGHVKM